MSTIEVKTDTGAKIYIEGFGKESLPEPMAGGGTIAGGKKAAEKISELGDVGDAIADVCKTLQTRIQSALEDAKPTELTLEFGVTLAGEMGIPFVTKGSAEGTFQVAAKWDFSQE